MLQVLEQVIALCVLCVMLKQSFAFFPPFWIGVYKHMENKGKSIQHSGVTELTSQYSMSLYLFCISVYSA